MTSAASSPEWTTERWIEVFGVQSTRLRAALAAADPATPVPTCPGWTFTELTLHVARFLEVSVRYLRTASRVQLAPPPVPAGQPPLDYLDGQLAEANEVLSVVPGNRAVWTFSPAAPDLAWVWHRRIAHELNLRRFDAQAALRTLEPTMPDQALDGIDEGLGTLVPAKATTDVPLLVDGTVLVESTDLPATWFVRFTPGEVPQVRRGPAGEPDATIRGGVTSVYYWLWGRVELADAAGDHAVAAALRLD